MIMDIYSTCTVCTVYITAFQKQIGTECNIIYMTCHILYHTGSHFGVCNCLNMISEHDTTLVYDPMGNV